MNSYIWVDNQPIKTSYLMQNGHVMIPVLFFKHTGASVDWNTKYQSVDIERHNIVSFPSEKNYMDYYIRKSRKWKRDKIAATITSLGSGTYIPLVTTAQKMGMKVTYDVSKNRMFIQTNTPADEKPVVYHSGNTTEKKIALTFDDGPDNIYTAKILDILSEKGVQATFFVLGQQVKYFPDFAKRIVSDGHTIANHTWNHPELSKLTTADVIQQVKSTTKEIETVTGVKTDLFRPPYGDYTAADLRVLQERGYKSVLWSVDTKDFSGNSAKDILAIVHRDKSPGGIVLQHNFQPLDRRLDGTVEALPQIIDQLRKEGYEFVTVDNLIKC
ncbi:polysaccharide deacetylase family protein [Sporosarcina sp. ANT_H38]|uniref:polysaccharide deacetylase family protein n=1 Tax=Sporosarcina sp. ANT_H38 TaxID=2597358 RepID=UPI0011F0C9E4|nr:polysaccharide deacetylase family protein [Sporosarcina sp. ANT_H38]KAA0965428.1 polysaccharide deacetylase family protein [Sporosarcina sp. ANT_H38]